MTFAADTRCRFKDRDRGRTRTADCRSRAPTRAPLLRGLSRDAGQGAPAGAAAPRGADRPARQHRRVPKPSPPGRPSCHRHARPNCGSPARSARTRRRDRRDHARCEPDRPSDGGTPAPMGHLSWPWDHLLRKRGGVHESGSTPISGILRRYREGLRWRAIPAEYGPRTTLFDLFNRRSQRRLWQDLLAALAGCSEPPEIAMADSTAVRAHRSAAAAKGGSTARQSAARAAAAPPKSMRSVTAMVASTR